MDIWRIPPSSTLQRYPWCGNNTQVSVAAAGRRYGPISNLHGNVPVIRWEQQSTHVLQPASLKLDLYVRNVWRTCHNCTFVCKHVSDTSNIYTDYKCVSDNRKKLLVTKRKAIFINSRQGAWDSDANYVHTHARMALEYNKEYPGFELGIYRKMCCIEVFCSKSDKNSRC